MYCGLWKLIWFPLFIPKHDFIVWLALQNALSIGSKPLQCGYGGVYIVVFAKVLPRIVTIYSLILVREYCAMLRV
jgi:hypothetical protein